MWRTSASLLAAMVVLLLTLGIIMLASTSMIQGENVYGDAYHFLKMQVVWLTLSLLVGFVASRIPYPFWRKTAIPLAVFSVFALTLVWAPHIGRNINGSSRWVRLGPLGFQPSEIAKFSAIVLLAWYMARIQHHAHQFIYGLIIPMGVLGLYLGLIFLEPDFGTTFLLAAVGMAILYLGGTRFSYLLVTALVGLTGFAIAVMHNPVRMRRIFAFLDPLKYSKHEAYQLLGSIDAFVVGGPYGTGLGEGLQKQHYLPEAHTDFILAVIGEELGFGATLGVLLAFTVIFYCGLRISMKAPDHFGRLLGLGFTLMISLQAAINIGVVTGCLPTKGLPLPFISFGGTSLIVSMAMVGVLLNLSGFSLEENSDVVKRRIKNRVNKF